MNQNNDNSSGNNSPAPKVSFATKASLIGTGVLIGLVIYPFVRKTLSKVQPKVDEIFDTLTGKAEDLAEKASDFMSKTREQFDKTEKSSENANGHSHSHKESAH